MSTVPGVIARFLRTASVAFVAGRSTDLVPCLVPVSGWSLKESGTEIEFLVSDLFAGPLSTCFQENNRIALTVERIGPHETYQFKGRCGKSRPMDENDMVLHEQCRERFVEACGDFLGFPEAISRRYPCPPSLALTLEVDEIYLQTPGPGAGKRLVPPEE